MRPVLVLAVLAAMPLSLAAQDFDKVVITSTPVAGNVAMLQGAGGNIGVLSGQDGVLVIDDQYAPLSAKIRAAVGTLAPNQPIRFVLNTHWHGDHTGGNEAMAKDAGAVLVAHENVRKRMSTEQFIKALKDSVHASPAAALPVVTFLDGVTFYLDGDTVEVMHVAPAHTDGDAIIRFRHANVIHAGDTFFNGIYPFIDVSSGGSIDGIIAACDKILAMSDDNTKIIPGHGDLTDKKGLLAYRTVVAGLRKNIAAAMKGGKTLSQVLKAQPTKPWDATWGKGFMNPETFVTLAYEDLKRTVK